MKTTRYGNPWTYVLRDVLYEATNMQSALDILGNTHRTCTIHLGLGSSKDHTFRMLEYSEQMVNNYDDKNYTHYTNSHPKKQGIAYFDKFIQPSNNDCVGSLLTDVIVCIFSRSFTEIGMLKAFGESLECLIRQEIPSI